jgi:AcrR family transcriptional regulator
METTDEIMAATSSALCAHGYADLTMQRIADEASMTTAAIHYHFDTKEGLMDAFLRDLTDRFEARLDCDDPDPRDRLATLLDAAFEPPDRPTEGLPVALMELKVRAAHRPAYRERFRELDERIRAAVAEAVRAGVAEGVFDDADPEAVARSVVAAIDGAHARRVALGEDPAETRATVERELEGRLGWAPGAPA